MTVRERVYGSLKVSQGPLCDDCLVPLAQVNSRQVARAAALSLAEAGLIVREIALCSLCRREKNVSRVGGMLKAITPGDDSEHQPLQRPWYWEGHVQTRLVRWLEEQGFLIQSFADTAARTAGKDIIAIAPTGQPLWVSVKGYPEKSAPVQARHWFAGAVFDIVLYRNEATVPDLAVAFPDGFATYRALAARMAALRAAMPFTIYWVAESGTVRVE